MKTMGDLLDTIYKQLKEIRLDLQEILDWNVIRCPNCDFGFAFCGPDDLHVCRRCGYVFKKIEGLEHAE